MLDPSKTGKHARARTGREERHGRVRKGAKRGTGKGQNDPEQKEERERERKREKKA